MHTGRRVRRTKEFHSSHSVLNPHFIEVHRDVTTVSAASRARHATRSNHSDDEEEDATDTVVIDDDVAAALPPRGVVFSLNKQRRWELLDALPTKCVAAVSTKNSNLASFWRTPALLKDKKMDENVLVIVTKPHSRAVYFRKRRNCTCCYPALNDSITRGHDRREAVALALSV